MPTLSTFYGIIIRMYWKEHNPPHFHAIYAGQEILVNILTMEVISGLLPRRAMALILEWAILHREELLEAWNKCSNNELPSQIQPLD